jgi:hypothetical protein
MLFLGSKLKLNLKKNLRNNHLIDVLEKKFKTKIFEIRSKKKVINIIIPENKIFLFNSTIFSRTRFA